MPIELTFIGWIHTLASLIALLCGFAGLVRDGEIRPDRRLGKVFLATTAVAALTALGIYQRGDFGPGHILAILTLGAIAVGFFLRRNVVPGSWRHVASALSFSVTILFHLIPGATETLTRLPVGAPFAESTESPALKPIFLGLLVLFAILALVQTRDLRRRAAIAR